MTVEKIQEGQQRIKTFFAWWPVSVFRKLDSTETRWFERVNVLQRAWVGHTFSGWVSERFIEDSELAAEKERINNIK